jgi:hypothetical protein
MVTTAEPAWASIVGTSWAAAGQSRTATTVRISASAEVARRRRSGRFIEQFPFGLTMLVGRGDSSKEYAYQVALSEIPIAQGTG